MVQQLTLLAQRSSFVDIDSDLIIDRPTQNIKGAVLNQLDLISKTTKADIFLLMPKTPDIESASFNGNLDSTMDPRLRCAIYGDLETMEHAKTRVLIMIDQIVGSPVFPSPRANRLLTTPTTVEAIRRYHEARADHAHTDLRPRTQEHQDD